MLEDNAFSGEIGSVRIADEVVAIIAGMAAVDVPGISEMSGGLADGIADILGKKNLSRGVRVALTESDVIIDMNIIVDYGCRIPDVAWNVQEKVKKAIEEMTGLNVVEVNIHIQGVSFLKEHT